MGYLGPKTCPKLKKVLIPERCSKLNEARISHFSPIQGEFPSEMHKTYDVCLCKIHKRMLPKGFRSFNDKHVNLSLLEDFYSF